MSGPSAGCGSGAASNGAPLDADDVPRTAGVKRTARGSDEGNASGDSVSRPVSQTSPAQSVPSIAAAIENNCVTQRKINGGGEASGGCGACPANLPADAAGTTTAPGHGASDLKNCSVRGSPVVSAATVNCNTPPAVAAPSHERVRRPRRVDVIEALPNVERWEEGLRILAATLEPPVVLVDMDNTLCDWEGQFRRLMMRHHPQIPIVPPDNRREFKIELNYDESYRDRILRLTALDKFWLSMDPTEGAVAALRAMAALGLIVFVVTTPDWEFTARSAAEKVEWVERHLGAEWKSRLIIATEKTLVKGDILIDDKPGASCGVLRPTWTHIIYSQPYNSRRSDCPILRYWDQWGPVVYCTLLQREHLKNAMLSEVCGESSEWAAHVARIADYPRQLGARPAAGGARGGGSNCCCGSSRYASAISAAVRPPGTLFLKCTASAPGFDPAESSGGSTGGGEAPVDGTALAAACGGGLSLAPDYRGSPYIRQSGPSGRRVTASAPPTEPEAAPPGPASASPATTAPVARGPNGCKDSASGINGNPVSASRGMHEAL